MQNTQCALCLHCVNTVGESWMQKSLAGRLLDKNGNIKIILVLFYVISRKQVLGLRPRVS